MKWGQWSWQSGRFWYQRSPVQIESLAKFYNEHCNCPICYSCPGKLINKCHSFFCQSVMSNDILFKKMSKCAKMFCVNPTKWFFVWKYCKRQNCRETNFCPKKLWTRVDLINFEFPFGIDRFEIYIFVVKIDDNDDNQKKFIKRSFQKSLKNLTSHDLFVRWGDDELKVVIIIQRY